MTAGAGDKWKKVGVATATTLSSPGYTIGDTSITVASTTNMPTDTGITVAIDVIDSSGERVAGTYNEYECTVASATSLANFAHVTGSGTNRNYSAGATTRVYIPVSANQVNDMVDGLMVEHNQDGTHGTTTYSGVATFATNIDVNDASTAIRDSSDNELVKFAKTASAVNEVTVTNNSTGNAPSITATGGDTNINLRLQGKGTGGVWVDEYQPYKFLVYRNAATNTGNGAFAKVTFDTEVYDTNSNFATGTYTAPVAGFYHFSWQATTSAATTDLVAAIYVNGSIYAWGSQQRAQGGSAGSIDLQLAANDTIDIYAYGNTTIALTVGSAPIKTYFSGHLISRT